MGANGDQIDIDTECRHILLNMRQHYEVKKFVSKSCHEMFDYYYIMLPHISESLHDFH